MHLLHALRAESFEPGHFGVQIVGMNVQVDARRAGFQALHEQHQVVPAEEGAVIFGGVDLWQLLPERALPECQFLVVQIGFDGEPAGMQDLLGVQFAALGTVGTFSWLGPGYRGRGPGTEMRAAMLHLAFAGLGAREATSEAFADNHASNRVSQTLGYQPNGTGRATRRGEPALITRWKLTRDQGEKTRRDDIEITGVQDCLPVLGL